MGMSSATVEYYLEYPEIGCTCNWCSLQNPSSSFYLENHDELSVSSTILAAETKAAINVLQQLREENTKRCIIGNLNINSMPKNLKKIRNGSTAKPSIIYPSSRRRLIEHFPIHRSTLVDINYFDRIE